MIRLAKTLPIPGTFLRTVVSAEFSSTIVPRGHFSTLGYEGEWGFDSFRMRLDFHSEGILVSFEWDSFLSEWNLKLFYSNGSVRNLF